MLPKDFVSLFVTLFVLQLSLIFMFHCLAMTFKSEKFTWQPLTYGNLESSLLLNISSYVQVTLKNIFKNNQFNNT